MDDIDVNKSIVTVLTFDEILIIASNELNVSVWSQSVHGVLVNVSLVFRVYISPKRVYPDYGVKIA